MSLGSLNFVFRRNPISFVITHTAVIFEFVNIFLITAFADKTFELRCCTKPFNTGKSLQYVVELFVSYSPNS